MWGGVGSYVVSDVGVTCQSLEVIDLWLSGFRNLSCPWRGVVMDCCQSIVVLV